MLLRIAYCDDEIENGKKIRDYINQLMIQIEVEFELDFYVSGTVLLENVKKQNVIMIWYFSIWKCLI